MRRIYNIADEEDDDDDDEDEDGIFVFTLVLNFFSINIFLGAALAIVYFIYW